MIYPHKEKFYLINEKCSRLDCQQYHKTLFKITTNFGVKYSLWHDRFSYIKEISCSPMILCLYFPVLIPEIWLGECVEAQDEYLQEILEYERV